MDINLLQMHASVNCEKVPGECYHYPLSLSVFEHVKIFTFAKSHLTDSWSLPSLLAPFSDPVAATPLLLAFTVAATTLCVLQAVKPWVVCDSLLAVLAGLAGKCKSVWGNPRSLIFYSFWLLLACFISITYTNILQSFMVVVVVTMDPDPF